MTSGVKKDDIVLGTGEEAVRGKVVVASVRMFLNHGTELTTAIAGGPRMRIDLGHRDCIAGLRYGIEGMRIGGQRMLRISPHLAYGSKGVSGHIPPNAVIRCEVELLDVRESGAMKPEDYPPGKHLLVFHPGEATRRLSRWQFGLEEDGRCGVTITDPIEGLAWRHARCSTTEFRLNVATAKLLFDEASELPTAFAKDCFSYGDLWADMTERGNAITREKFNNRLCLTLSVMERGEIISQYSLAENSAAFDKSTMLKIIYDLIKSGDRKPLSRHGR